MDYPNINHLVLEELGLREDEVFTPFTNSSFYSPDGLEATAPVFSQGAEIFGQRIPELPSPLGQVAATFDLFERIPIPDRVTMVGLLTFLDMHRYRFDLNSGAPSVPTTPIHGCRYIVAHIGIPPQTCSPRVYHATRELGTVLTAAKSA